MSATPGNVMRAAVAHFRSSPVEFEAGLEGGAVLRCIIDAIMAERERCAKIAEGDAVAFQFQEALADCRDHEHGYNSARLAIASAIRNGG